MKRKIVAACLAVSMILSGVVIMPKKVKAADTINWDGTTYQMKDYWSEDNKKVPVKEGYIFGGWHTKVDEDKYVALKESELSDEAVLEIEAYAKFVPDTVLSVKTQVSETYEQDGKTRRAVRLLSTVDGSDYQKVGFKYMLGSGKEQNMEMKKVYTAIQKSKSDTNLIYPNVFSGVSQYFIAMDVNKISETNWSNAIYARPYWVTMDGTEVNGLARNNRVEDNDATGTDYTSVPINLLTDGKKMPSIAAGTFVFDYSSYGLDIATDDSGNHLIDTGKVFEEMSYTVNELSKTITFVGNGGTANERIIGDGLFANIRFTNDNTVTALEKNITYKNISFCNWNENVLKKDAVVVR